MGTLSRGRYDGITDVPGVCVNHVTIISGASIRDGATGIMPNADPWRFKVAAATYVINGNGALTNRDWIDESGRLETPVVLVGNTLDVGRAYDGVVSQMIEHHPGIGRSDDVPLPVVGEIDGQRLDDVQARAVTPARVVTMLDGAHGGAFARGAVGAGTPSTSFGYKGGIGSSSRVLPAAAGGYTVGVLVNANMEARDHLIMGGIPAGRLLPHDDLPRMQRVAVRERGRAADGSIIIVVATNAPVDALQLRALAKRSAAGLFRAGSISRVSSGDLVIAFSTARITAVDAHGDLVASSAPAVEDETVLNSLSSAVADATESAIDDALLSAKTTSGNGATVFALPKDRLRALLAHPPSPLDR